ncbi:hypothetical protein SUGI_0490760 [Cryptomeria japonica]|uniref:GDSL esterase/lipase At4g28780-like n=1 Tax=Cryptomeria japonica TaxID=3369 RepID=UPI002408EC06|nr:GDSL esterase/lipase At4g28780-like [Cryptomeria japonica]GLJ25617.1 hypothetical protein SUGI_0490760 [Cryptomeria japonica]
MEKTLVMILVALWGIQFAKAAAPAMIVFGDSLVDQGNNNYLLTVARCDYKPYGVDFPQGATGRFSNGRLISDFISEMMGTEPIEAWLSPQMRGDNLLRGVNFGSAGCGILDDTGSLFISRLTIPRQLQMFSQYQNSLRALIGEPATAELIRNAIYNVNAGGNDWVNNYLLPTSNQWKAYTPSQYIQILISTYKQHLKSLYTLGARKIVVSSLGPIGCAPSMLNRFNSPAGQCVSNLQQYAMTFNGALKIMLNQLTQQLPGSIFVYSNGFDMLMDYITNPKAYGFEVVDQGCCGQGQYKGFLTCVQLSSYCENREKYVFWDAYHLTELANKLLAKRIFYGPTSDISPMNVNQLMSISIK